MPVHTPNTGGLWRLACGRLGQREAGRGLHPAGPEHILGPVASAYFNKELFTALRHTCPPCLR